MKRLIALLLIVSGCAHSPRLLLNAHAHNDYLHPRPLYDALNAGFCSVEADIWLVDGELLVAHDRAQTQAGKTLQRLYLDPLHEFIKHDDRPITLFIDIKSDAEPTYEKLREVLVAYASMLTNYDRGRIHRRAVSVLITGNRPFEMIAAEEHRLVAIDGTAESLVTSPPVNLVPQVSIKWTEAVQRDFKSLIECAHLQGRNIRFYATPDNPQTWRMLRNAGVDLINTDNLTGLRDFLQGENRSRAAR